MILRTWQLTYRTAWCHILEYQDFGHKFLITHSVTSWISHSHNLYLSQIQMSSYAVCSRHVQLLLLYQGETAYIATQNQLLNVLYRTFPSLWINNFQLPHLSAFPHTRLYSHKMNQCHFIWCLSWTANWSSPDSKEILCLWGTWRFTVSVHTSLSLDSILSQLHGDHPMYLRSKLIQSPAYTLISQVPSSLQIFTPQFPQLTHAFYISCLHHPHSFDHAYQSYFLHWNTAFGTFYRYCNTCRYHI